MVKKTANNLKLIDVHRHLDGDISISTILKLAAEINLSLPSQTEAGLVKHALATDPAPDLSHFLKKMLLGVSVLHNYKACELIAYEAVMHVFQEGLSAAELRFSPLFMAAAHSLNPSVVIESVIQGVERAKNDYKVDISLIGILSRTYGPEMAMAELKHLIKYAKYFVAIDLAGDELMYPAKLFQEHFDAVRSHGLGVTIHAGEAGPPSEIADAIVLLGATRIGHGTALCESPEVLELVLEKKVGLEVCLTSNLQTGAVKTYTKHPIISFINNGVLCTLATDDPGVLGIDLNYEYSVAGQLSGLSEDHKSLLIENGWEMRFSK